MHQSDARNGMRVVFGRPGPHAEKSLGVIEKCNPSTAKVKLLEERGTNRDYPVGTIFTVHYSLMEPEPVSGNKHDVKIARRERHAADTTEIVVGITTFRYHHADGNPLWRVIRKSGPESYVCRVENEKIVIDGEEYDSDWAGTEKAFLATDILRSIGMDKLFDGMRNEHDDYFKSLKPGQTVHYHNGFGNYVRCTVVVKDGANVLKPFALVGAWRSHDLPRRLQDGSLSYAHYPKMIADGETFTPNYSNIYETGKVEKQPDPRNMPVIDLTVPDMTPEAAATAELWQKVRKIHELTSATAQINGANDPKAILLEVAKVI